VFDEATRSSCRTYLAVTAITVKTTTQHIAYTAGIVTSVAKKICMPAETARVLISAARSSGSLALQAWQ
jgi:hypothetical protein